MTHIHTTARLARTHAREASYLPLVSPPRYRLSRTNERTGGERGEPEAGLCASEGAVSLPTPLPFLRSAASSSLFSIPAVQTPLLTAHTLITSYPKGFIEEMRELEKLRTETMMKSCQSTTSRAGAIRCPVPRKSGRSYKEYDLTQDLSDFIMSKASPPYFTGSPPVRASNPLVHDTQFCAWKLQNVDQSLSIPIPTKGRNVRYCVREGYGY
uniref:Uncharacterized protein n=1 Tax=Oryza punctata TaxID=4537 RepID=A0A0E0LEB3_ORYPU